jgi:hypothetical protein
MIKFCPLDSDYNKFNVAVLNEDHDNIKCFIRFLIKMKEAGILVNISEDEIMSRKITKSIIINFPITG